MTSMFLMIVIVTSMFTMFSFSYRINGLNRVIINTPVELFECSVPLVDTIDAHFSRELLENKHKEYLEKNVHQYVASYDVKYFYYLQGTPGEVFDDNCDGVEIYFTSKIFSFSYERTMFYEIKEGGYGKN